MNYVNLAVPASKRSLELPAQPIKRANGEPDIVFKPFTDGNYVKILGDALLFIENTTIKDANVLRKCNAWYEIMSRDRGIFKTMLSFERTWKDPATLICFWPNPTGYASAMTYKNFITLSERNFLAKNPVETTAATLMHELAHTAGAAHDTKDAEESLAFCGFSQWQTPGLVG